MAQSGLHVPAGEGSQFPIFDDVLTDIGDEQSLEQSLSTFSSHVGRIREILGQATPRSLVLLDELGAGTDPTDGAALGRAILDELDRIGCRAIVTTHIGDLKTYALSNAGAENAAVEFDDETFRPKYRLLIGNIGVSNALKIARQLRLPEHVVARAEAYLAQSRSGGTPDWEVLLRLRKEAEEAREAAMLAQAEAERTREALAERMAELQKESQKADTIAEARARLQPGDRVVVPRLGYDRPGPTGQAGPAQEVRRRRDRACHLECRDRRADPPGDPCAFSGFVAGFTGRAQEPAGKTSRASRRRRRRMNAMRRGMPVVADQDDRWRLEEQDTQRRDPDRQVERAAGVLFRHAPGTPLVAGVRPAVDLGVAVEDFPVVSAGGNADPVILAHDRREVTDHDDGVFGVLGPAQERDHAVFPVVQLEPFVPLPLEVDLVQSGLRLVERVQVAHQTEDALVIAPLEQVPVEAFVVVPFTPLRDLAPHEEQLLPRVAVHVAVKEPEVREFLPEVARHLVEQRSLAVHDLVVREGEDEVFTERVDHAEGERTVFVLAIDRVFGEIAQRVVHPAHVPLEAEAQASQVSGSRHARPAR